MKQFTIKVKAKLIISVDETHPYVVNKMKEPESFLKGESVLEGESLSKAIWDMVSSQFHHDPINTILPADIQGISIIDYDPLLTVIGPSKPTE